MTAFDPCNDPTPRNWRVNLQFSRAKSVIRWLISKIRAIRFTTARTPDDILAAQTRREAARRSVDKLLR